MNLMNIISSREAKYKNIAVSLHFKRFRNRQTNLWCLPLDGSYLLGRRVSEQF